MPEIKLIAALDDKNGIARENSIPWDLPTDRKYFRNMIMDSLVVMGWKTFATNKFKPFGNGDNVVLTRRDISAAPGVWIVNNAKKFFETHDEDMWVIGGGQIYTEALPYATTLYLTRVQGTYDCDVFFPEFETKFTCINKSDIQQENGIEFYNEIWMLKN